MKFFWRIVNQKSFLLRNQSFKSKLHVLTLETFLSQKDKKMILSVEIQITRISPLSYSGWNPSVKATIRRSNPYSEEKILWIKFFKMKITCHYIWKIASAEIQENGCVEVRLGFREKKWCIMITWLCSFWIKGHKWTSLKAE